jgi:arsenite/tail-anchored protein-transporting ATPase
MYSNSPLAIRSPLVGVPNLFAMEIDPDKATQEYIDRAMVPIRAAFPSQMVQVMEEQMSGPCTAEVAAFDRFTDFLDTPTENGTAFDVVIFDTAPTGHTIRLLELPAEWSQSIDAASAGNGQTCLGPAAAIQDAKHKYERALAAMRESSQTTFIFVLHPEAISIKETRRAIGELKKLDIENYRLIVNGIIPPEGALNPLFAARSEMQERYLSEIETSLPYPKQRMSLLAGEIKGVERLRKVGSAFFDGVSAVFSSLPVEDKRPEGSVSSLYDVRVLVQPNGHRRTLFFAGKGGVGKTVASCITAVWLARQGYKTLLLTTDPAAHLGDVLGVPVGDDPTTVPVRKTCGRSILTRKLPPRPTRPASWTTPASEAGPNRPSRLWRRSWTRPAPKRWPPSTSSSSTPRKRDGRRWCSIPPPPATPCACSSSRWTGASRST